MSCLRVELCKVKEETPGLELELELNWNWRVRGRRWASIFPRGRDEVLQEKREVERRKVESVQWMSPVSENQERPACLFVL